MIAVIFEAEAHGIERQACLDAAAALRPLLDKMSGFMERHRSWYPSPP
jgi:hypothetical protein